MRKIIGILVLTVIATCTYGQRSVDALFNKYSGRDGFTTITISGDLLKIAGIIGNGPEDKYPAADISMVRILVQDDEGMVVDNFYEMIINDINLRDYEEYMRVKEKDKDLRMLVRSEGNRFREFLLIGGGEDNLVVQVKGNLTYRDARKFSSDLKKDQGMDLVINSGK